MDAAKMGFGSDRRRVTRTYGYQQQITVDGTTFTVKSDAEAIFFRELGILIQAGAVKEWWYEPQSFKLNYKYSHGDYLDNYTPDARIIWVNPDIGEEWFEIKRGALESKYAGKLVRFTRQYPQHKLVLVWVGSLPAQWKRNGKSNPVWGRFKKVEAVVDHVWHIQK